MKKILFLAFLVLFGVLGCTVKDAEIIKLLNSLKAQNDQLLIQLNAVKKTTDSAFVAVSKINASQPATDAKVEAVKLELKNVLSQIAQLNVQITSNSGNIADLKSQIDLLQQKCSELIAQIVYLTSISQSFSLNVDISPLSSGAVQISPVLELYKYGTEITITASPNIQYVFKQWAGDTLATTNPLKFKITKNVKLTAVFENVNTLSVKDLDGNTYSTVKIGNQVWMKENLNVTKFQNGDVIPNIIDGPTWAKLATGAWARYNNDADKSNKLKIGLLYNGFVAQDSRNVCPAGYRVPSDTDLQELINHLGGGKVAGAKLMEEKSNTSLWSNNLYGTNSSGFTALPGGLRWGNFGDWRNGNFEFALGMSTFWTNTNTIGGGAITLQLINSTPETLRVGFDKTYGQSIRCIKN